jgi:hypothetical protein
MSIGSVTFGTLDRYRVRVKLDVNRMWLDGDRLMAELFDGKDTFTGILAVADSEDGHGDILTRESLEEMVRKWEASQSGVTPGTGEGLGA